MKAVVKVRREPYYRKDALDSGLKRVGFTLCDIQIPKGPDDWLILWNRKKGAEEQFADRWEKFGGTVIICENAYLQKVDKTFYAISVHGHNGSGWFPVGTEDRFTPLGFPIKPWRKGGTEVVVRAQRGIGSTLMASPPHWAEKLAAKLKARVIPHPGNFAPKVPPAADLAKASMLHIWCSSMGVLALTEGVPVKHHAPHWICDNSIDREAQLHRMSHGQWSVPEIASGEPFKRILEKIGEAKW